MNTTIFDIVLDMLAMHGQVNAAPVQEDQKSIRSFLNLTSLVADKKTKKEFVTQAAGQRKPGG